RFAAGQSRNVALIRSDTGLFARFHGRTGLVPRRAVVVSARAAGVPIIIATTISEIIIRMSLLLHQFLFRNAASRMFLPNKCVCGSVLFGSIIFPKVQRRTLWLGRRPSWLKSASVSKSTATCQPMVTCRLNSNCYFHIACLADALTKQGRPLLFSGVD